MCSLKIPFKTKGTELLNVPGIFNYTSVTSYTSNELPNFKTPSVIFTFGKLSQPKKLSF